MKWVLMLLLLVPSAYGWDWDTHEHIAKDICKKLNCPCMNEIINGSTVPDRVFKDNINHLCYSKEWPCSLSNKWTCPSIDRCPALEKASYWLNEAKKQAGCEKWYSIGIASHYLSDAYVFWHHVSNEPYEECHYSFERAVGEHLKPSLINKIKVWLGISWKVCKCGVCITNKEIEVMTEEVEITIAEKNIF